MYKNFLNIRWFVQNKCTVRTALTVNVLQLGKNSNGVLCVGIYLDLTLL